MSADSFCNLRYKMLKVVILVIFHNVSNYDNRFIIKQLKEEFEEQFEEKIQRNS